MSCPVLEWCDTRSPWRSVSRGCDSRCGRSMDQTPGYDLLQHKCRLWGTGLDFALNINWVKLLSLGFLDHWHPKTVHIYFFVPLLIGCTDLYWKQCFFTEVIWQIMETKVHCSCGLRNIHIVCVCVCVCVCGGVGVCVGGGGGREREWECCLRTVGCE